MTINDIADGILCIDKPIGMTSHDVVNRIRRLYCTKQVGHTGTLDPMATGVLVVLVGRAVKSSEYLCADKKEYECTLRLGITTDTEDTSGKILSSSENIPSPSALFDKINTFVGDIMQVPPMYSALKVNGKKLVDIARKGETVERTARKITVYSISAKQINSTDYKLNIVCSKGTYIRTLCADIGASLGCGGVMAALRRTKSGIFSISECHTLEELEKEDVQTRISHVLPTENLFSELPKVKLVPFYTKLYKSGAEIYLKKINLSLPCGARAAVYDENGFYSLGEVFEYPDGLALKSLKLFKL